MEPVYSLTPLIAILLSLSAAVLIPLTGRKHRNIREFWTLFASVAKFLVIISMYPYIATGGQYIFSFFELLPGVGFTLRVDTCSMYFALLSAFLWIMTSLYSIGYMRLLHEHAQTRYYTFFAICITTTVGIAFADNLLTLFIFYELLTLATYPLVIHEETPEALAAGRKYLIYLVTAGVFILFGMVITYSLTGTLQFSSSGILAGSAGPDVLRALFIIFIIGFGTKAAIMPLHGWLPSAMVAPTPVSALLHAVAVVKAGIFGIVRVMFYIFGIDLLRELGVSLPLATVASITIILASLFALSQDNLKLRLAYSTVSQLSYIVLGLALLTPDSITGGIVHIANQAFMKITLFFCAGAIFVQTGKRNLSDMYGIGRRMPFTMLAFTIAALGMCGIPLAAGFVSKWYLCMGTLEANQPIFLVVLLTSALLNLAYFLPPIYNAYFREPDREDEEDVHRINIFIRAPLIVTAIASLILGIIPKAPMFPLEMAISIVNQLMGVVVI